MRWRLFNLAAVLSLLLCVVTAAQWVRSYFVEDTLVRGTRERIDSVTTARGRLVVELLIGNHPTPGYSHWTLSFVHFA